MLLQASLVMFALLAPSQRAADLSGTWVLDAGFVTGGTRGGDGGEGPRKTSSHTSSGAAFNCGTECVLTLKGNVLTVDGAQLADYPGKDPSQRTPPVSFTLNGKQVKVVDSFSPSRMLLATAARESGSIRIETVDGRRQTRQVIAREGSQLVVRSAHVVDGQTQFELLLKYRRK